MQIPTCPGTPWPSLTGRARDPHEPDVTIAGNPIHVTLDLLPDPLTDGSSTSRLLVRTNYGAVADIVT